MTIVHQSFMITRYLCRFLQEISINRLIHVCIVCIYNFLGCTTAFANKYPIISYPTSGGSSHFYKVPYTGHFTAVNGSYFDASQYYKSQRTELHISGFTAVFLNETWEKFSEPTTEAFLQEALEVKDVPEFSKKNFEHYLRIRGFIFWNYQHIIRLLSSGRDLNDIYVDFMSATNLLNLQSNIHHDLVTKSL